MAKTLQSSNLSAIYDRFVFTGSDRTELYYTNGIGGDDTEITTLKLTTLKATNIQNSDSETCVTTNSSQQLTLAGGALWLGQGTNSGSTRINKIGFDTSGAPSYLSHLFNSDTNGSGYFEIFESLLTTTDTINDVIHLTVRTSGTVDDNFGAGIRFNLEDDNNVAQNAGSLCIRYSDATNSARDSEFVVKLSNNNSIGEKFQVESNGDTVIAGDVTILGNDIRSSTTTALTFSGADVTVAGDLTVTGNDIIFGSAAKLSDNNGYMSIQQTGGSTNFGLLINTQDAGTDSYLSFLEAGTIKWNLGNDGSDSDKFKISSNASANLHTDTELTLDSSGNLTIVGQYNGYTILVLECSYFDDVADTVFLPMSGQTTGEDDTPDTNSIFTRRIMPYDGYLSKIVFRTTVASDTTDFSLYKTASGTSADGTDSASATGATVSVENTSASTSHTASFGTGYSFDAGDIIAIKCATESAPYDMDICAVFMVKVS
jgi:hypothetical protein